MSECRKALARLSEILMRGTLTSLKGKKVGKLFNKRIKHIGIYDGLSDVADVSFGSHGSK